MNLFKKVKKIHFVGIGGAGMIGIARLLLKKGYKVSGSDIVESNDLKKLRKDGAKVFIGHTEKNIKGANLIVFSSAIDIPDKTTVIAQNATLADGLSTTYAVSDKDTRKTLLSKFPDVQFITS